ncbi:MAG: hypothetical protein ACLPN5_20905 [Roseiarcus sp.]
MEHRKFTDMRNPYDAIYDCHIMAERVNARLKDEFAASGSNPTLVADV